MDEEPDVDAFIKMAQTGKKYKPPVAKITVTEDQPAPAAAGTKTGKKPAGEKPLEGPHKSAHGTIIVPIPWNVIGNPGFTQLYVYTETHWDKLMSEFAGQELPDDVLFMCYNTKTAKIANNRAGAFRAYFVEHYTMFYKALVLPGALVLCPESLLLKHTVVTSDAASEIDDFSFCRPWMPLK